MKKNKLFLRVIIGMILGICIGLLFPHFAVHLKILATIFIRLIKMVIAPIIFICIVLGINSHREEGGIGGLAVRTLIYLEIMSIVATLIPFVLFPLLKPGKGVHLPNLHQNAVQLNVPSSAGGFKNFFVNIIPENFLGTLSGDNFIAIIILATLFGFTILKLSNSEKILNFFNETNRIFFKMIHYVALLAPFAAFGAIASTVGQLGSDALFALSNFIGVLFLSMALFCVVLFTAAHLYKIKSFKLIKHIKEEIFIALGTSSSEAIFPQLLEKLESFGCSKKVVGFVLPTGYAFNLTGTAMYVMGAIFFIQQIYNVPLTFSDYAVILGTVLVVSKGAAGVSGAGFITLSATIVALPANLIPIEGLAILLGIDLLMSNARTIINVLGNALGTVFIAKAQNEFTDNSVLIDEKTSNSFSSNMTITEGAE